MFYVAQMFLLGEGLKFSKHSTVINKFGEFFAKSQRVPVKFHRYLIESQMGRIAGDYTVQSGLTQQDVELNLSRAQEFLELAMAYFDPNPPDNPK